MSNNITKEECLRCGGRMIAVGTEKIQLGQYGFFSGPWSNILSGGLEVSIFICSDCQKIEFYSVHESEENLPQKKCPKCGSIHDFDYGRCPNCKYEY